MTIWTSRKDDYDVIENIKGMNQWGLPIVESEISYILPLLRINLIFVFICSLDDTALRKESERRLESKKTSEAENKDVAEQAE